MREGVKASSAHRRVEETQHGEALLFVSGGFLRLQAPICLLFLEGFAATLSTCVSLAHLNICWLPEAPSTHIDNTVSPIASGACILTLGLVPG